MSTNPVINNFGTKLWYNKKGELHRLDGPAAKWSDGAKHWYQNSKLHRLDGPAAECNDGTKYWYQNGKRHRLDGPAIEYSNGDKVYYQYGHFHRLDGPAVEYSNGDKYWFIEGKELTEEEFIKRTEPPVKYLSNVKPQNRWDALYEE